ncbi:hypothetical protein GEMRC1_004862 [Eukaryota sp. GEM-RC1]
MTSLTKLYEYLDAIKSCTSAEADIKVPDEVLETFDLLQELSDSDEDEETTKILEMIFKSSEDALNVFQLIQSVKESPCCLSTAAIITSTIAAAASEYLANRTESSDASPDIASLVESLNPENPSVFGLLYISKRLMINKSYSMSQIQPLLSFLEPLLLRFSQLTLEQAESLRDLICALETFIIPPQQHDHLFTSWFRIIIDQLDSIPEEFEDVLSDTLDTFCGALVAEGETLPSLLSSLKEKAHISKPQVFAMAMKVFTLFAEYFASIPDYDLFILSVLRSKDIHSDPDRDIFGSTVGLLGTISDSLPDPLDSKAFKEFYQDTESISFEDEAARGVIAFAFDGLDLQEFKVIADRIISNISSNLAISLLGRSSIAAGFARRGASVSMLNDILSAMIPEIPRFDSSGTFDSSPGSFEFFGIMICNVLSQQKSIVSSLKKNVFQLVKSLRKLYDACMAEEVASAINYIVDNLEQRIDLPESILRLKVSDEESELSEEEEEED